MGTIPLPLPWMDWHRAGHPPKLAGGLKAKNCPFCRAQTTTSTEDDMNTRSVTNAQFPVRRLSPNKAVRQDLVVWARYPNEARKVASDDGWTVLTCGPAFWDSPADYGRARIAAGKDAAAVQERL